MKVIKSIIVEWNLEEANTPEQAKKKLENHWFDRSITQNFKKHYEKTNPKLVNKMSHKMKRHEQAMDAAQNIINKNLKKQK